MKDIVLVSGGFCRDDGRPMTEKDQDRIDDALIDVAEAQGYLWGGSSILTDDSKMSLKDEVELLRRRNKELLNDQRETLEAALTLRTEVSLLIKALRKRGLIG